MLHGAATDLVNVAREKCPTYSILPAGATDLVNAAACEEGGGTNFINVGAGPAPHPSQKETLRSETK